MSFAIELPEPTRRKILGWSLSGRLFVEILEHLYEVLAEKPIVHLERVPPPTDELQYSFIIKGEGEPPRDYLFVFNVRYRADEETLVIAGCDYLAL